MDKFEMLFGVDNLLIENKEKVLLSIPKLELSSGKFIAIIGANGAGKSTLIHALLGKKHPYQKSGSVHCFGDLVGDVVRLGKIAWVGQHERFELPLTVLDYALLGTNPKLSWYQKPSTSDIDCACQWLLQFDLLSLKDKRVQGLSGGEKQRLAIVRALMQDTQILLFDEPTNHLDVKHERYLFDFLKNLVDNSGKSIVVVLHSLTQAYRHADEIIALHQGRVLARGLPSAVMTKENLSQMYGADIQSYNTNHGLIFV